MKLIIKTLLGMILVNLISISEIYSQHFYLNAGIGYGLSAVSSISPNNYTSNYILPSPTTTRELIKGSGSFGKGIQVGATAGYMCNENFGIEVGIGYLMGNTIKSSEHYTTGTFSSTIDNTLKGEMYRITPAIIMTCGKGFVKPYLRTGLVIGIASKITNTSKQMDYTDFGNTITESTQELTGRMSLGFTGAVGTNIRINELISLFAEFNIVAQSWAPKKGKYTKYTVNGIDQLPNMSIYEKEIEFVDSYTEEFGTVVSSNPEKIIKVFFPFSSAGLNAGIHINL